MMDTRYHIEEMISQDERGVVFQGADTVTGVIVAIRRFISSGGRETEVSHAAREAFDEAIQRLKEVNHPSLRRILAGGCDSVDNMPYLVARWSEGSVLADQLSETDEPDQEFLRHLLLDYLEANATVEDALGKRGLWLENATASIFVKPARNDEEVPAALFWLCPWRWLQGSSDECVLAALADLAESVLGGPRRVSGYVAFADWIQAIRKQSIQTVEEARSALLQLQFQTESPAKLVPISPPQENEVEIAREAVREEEPSGFDAPGLKVVPAPVVSAPAVAVLPGEPEETSGSGRKMMVAAAVVLAVVAAAVFVALNRTSDAPIDSDVDVASVNAGSQMGPAAGTASIVQVPKSADEERRQFISRRGYYTIDEADLLHDLEKQEITFRGHLANVRHSSSKMTIYLEFSEDAPNEQPRVYCMVSNAVDGIRKEDLELLKGRLVEIKGKVDIETVGSIRRPRVELLDSSQIKMLDKEEDYQLR